MSITTRCAAAWAIAAFFAVAPGLVRSGQRDVRAWEPVGLSGGGAMFAPAISPANPERMMLNCDMSGAYVSLDGGRNWRMIPHDQLHASTRCKPAYHPTDPNTIFAADGGAGLKVSHDGGRHWAKTGNLPANLRGSIVIDSGKPASMLAGAGSDAYRSNDGGLTWTKCSGPQGEPLAFFFDRNATGRHAMFAATASGIWRSRDGGETWEVKATGLPAGPGGLRLLDFAGGCSAARGETILYCSVTSVVEDGRLVGGVYRSKDHGESWLPVEGEGLNRETKAYDPWAMGPIAQYRHIATSDARPRTVYAFNSNTGIPPPHQATVFRSDDAGATWRATYQADPRYPGMNVEPDYTVCEDGQYYQDVPSVAADASDPDRLVLVDMGGCHITADGGKTWQCGHASLASGQKPVSGASWLCNGLVVTTTWNYYIDPFRPDWHYICYTDIGFARSNDRGKSWKWWSLKGRSPWNNTCYELAFDPEVPGKVWGAFSNVHDIPNGNIIWGNHRDSLPGGVCVSTDSTETWSKSNAGLPAAAVTSVVVDPKSRAGSRTLYAGVFNHGVFKSMDDGRTWTPRNAGLGAPSNMRVCRVHLHPDGTLFALVTAMRRDGKFQQEGVGLYRSADGGDHWSIVNRSNPLLWPKDFTVDPRNSNVIYLSGCDTNVRPEGGLYRTTDGGAAWTRLAQKGSEHFGAYLHPKRPDWIYMTLTEGAPGAGLWLSKDDGATWTALNGLPFSNAMRVAFDPADPDTIYVTTFGGSVWRGPASIGANSQ